MQKNATAWNVLVLLTSSIFLHACGGSPKSSSTAGPGDGPIPTHRMTLELTVESNEPGEVVVRANLNDGKTLPRSYRLDGGDYLRACAIGTCRNMADNNSVYEPDYLARFDYLANVDYVVSFNRREAVSAPDSRAALPPEFYIATPADGQQVSDGDTVTLSWMPSGPPARVRLSYHAECDLPGGAVWFSSGALGQDDDGDGTRLIEVDPMVTPATPGAALPTRCSIDMIVEHELTGKVDPAFNKNSTARGIVSRKVTLDYIPRR